MKRNNPNKLNLGNLTSTTHSRALKQMSMNPSVLVENKYIQSVKRAETILQKKKTTKFRES